MKFNNYQSDFNSNDDLFNQLPPPNSDKIYDNNDLFENDSYSDQNTYSSNTSSSYNSASPYGTSSPFSGYNRAYDIFNQEQHHQHLNLYSDFAQQMPQEDLDNWENDGKDQSALEEIKTHQKISFVSSLAKVLFVGFVVFILSFLIYIFHANNHSAPVLIGFVLGIFLMAFVLIFIHHRKEYLFKRGLVSPTLKRMFHFDMDATKVFRRAFSLKRIIEQLQIDRRWTKLASSDNVLGVVNDLPFYFSDFKLTHSTGGNNSRTIIDFKGQIIFLPVFQTHIQDTITITRLGNEVNINTINAKSNTSYLSKLLFGTARGEMATSTIDGVCSNGTSLKDYYFKFCDTNLLFTKDFEKLRNAFSSPLFQTLTTNEIDVYDFDGQLNTAFCDALCQFTANYRQCFKIFIMKNIMIILLENHLDPFEIRKDDHKIDPHTVRQRLNHEAIWLKSLIYPFATMSNTSSGFGSNHL